jgi:hypothetical protein
VSAAANVKAVQLMLGHVSAAIPRRASISRQPVDIFGKPRRHWAAKNRVTHGHGGCTQDEGSYASRRLSLFELLSLEPLTSVEHAASVGESGFEWCIDSLV